MQGSVEGGAYNTRDLLARVSGGNDKGYIALGFHRRETDGLVPYVLPAAQAHFLIHVSSLATHTRDMLDHRRVSLLVTAETGGPWSPLALPRVSLQADAAPLERDGPEYEAARTHYLARFPDAAQMFELGDFSIVVLRPVSARLVAGFGRAHSLVGDALDDWLRTAPPATTIGD